MTLPEATTATAFATIRSDDAKLRPGVDAILARHGVSGEVVRFADGSVPVYAIGERVLKLFPPVYVEERDTEATALTAVAGKLSIPTPAVEAIGELEGWGYVLMQRLHGEGLAAVWPRLDDATRMRLVGQIGAALAELHAIDAPLGPPDWDAFVAAQCESAVERQRARGLDPTWLAQIDGFLATVDLTTPRRALLHTEVMREHLLVREDARGWTLSGLFDFEPAMRGAPEYELAAVGVFVSAGDPQLLHALLRAYGYAESELDHALARRLLGHALIHRYANVRWYLERLPAPGEPTLDALARRGWGTLGR